MKNFKPLNLYDFFWILDGERDSFAKDEQLNYYKLRCKFREELIKFIENENICTFSAFAQKIHDGAFSLNPVVQEVLKRSDKENYMIINDCPNPEEKKAEFATYALSEMFFGAGRFHSKMRLFADDYIRDRRMYSIDNGVITVRKNAIKGV